MPRYLTHDDEGQADGRGTVSLILPESLAPAGDVGLRAPDAPLSFPASSLTRPEILGLAHH